MGAKKLTISPGQVQGAPKLYVLKFGAHGASGTLSRLQNPAIQIRFRQCPQKLVELHNMGLTSMARREHES